MQHHVRYWQHPVRLGLGCLAALLMVPNAEAVELASDADVGVEESQPDDIEGHRDRIQVRSNNNAGRQNVGYIRFDLAGITTVNNATFSIARRNAVGWNTGQFQVYGLNDVAGNTPQDWVEVEFGGGTENPPTGGLTYPTTGAEVPGDGDATTQDLGSKGTTGTENLWALGDLPGLPTGGGLNQTEFSSPELVNFLNSRAGGLATLLLVNASGKNRELLFVSKESGAADSGPTLAINVPD